MLISLSWLKKYADLPDSITPEEIAEKLKMSTVEVEKIENKAKDLENIAVGKIIKVEKHPNADKLKVCEVDVSNEKITVVCGGSNLSEGMLVALAKIGANVRWHGEGDLIELQPTKIRGVESRGMICSSIEIGLGEMFPPKEEKEILDLSFLRKDKNSFIGLPLAKALNLDDAILEIDNKSLSHRPDLWGHYGIAREVAVLFEKKLVPYAAPKIIKGKDIKLEIKVEDQKLCPRYMAVAISGVKIVESPDWLKKSLISVGMRPINNIVDITNYVMLDLGQPMHAFDAKKLIDGGRLKIIVRRAKDEEVLKMIDGNEHKIYSSMLVIADENKPLALAGVMGGKNSEVNETTETVVFESANFDASVIRKTSVKLGLRTDASMRFEKSLDPNLCETALRRAVELALDLCPGAKVASAVEDVSDFILPVGPIKIPLDVFGKKIGVEIPAKIIIDILQRLGFEVKTNKDILSVKIPTWRATKDISVAEDLVEEVLRIYGYHRAPSQSPFFSIIPPEISGIGKLEREIKNTLVGRLNFTEAYNYSFVSLRDIEEIEDEVEKYIELDSPLSKDRPFVRRNLVINLLGNLKKNIEYCDEIRLFETGKTYLMEEPGARTSAKDDELLPRQDTWLTLVYASKKDKMPFTQARKALETIDDCLGCDFEISAEPSPKKWQHPERAAVVKKDGEEIGCVYEINPLTGEKFGLEVRIGVLELNLNKLSEKGIKAKTYSTISEYPEAVRDIAFIVKKEISHAEIFSAISGNVHLLKEIKLFDVYEGEKIGQGYKSMAYRFVFGDISKTLTAGEVDEARNKASRILEETFGAEVRR
ncbi:MAG: phenylalanine--tRNA ligase subunit beta [Patescibacteria group bacterium]|nr:phenylalanine--tRNA ligase subunit beta [Patescibacteria group bacterium]